MTQRPIAFGMLALATVKLMAQDPVLQWQHCLGGADWDQGYGVTIATDGNYLVAGNSSSSDGDVVDGHGGQDGLVAQFSTSGTLLWARTYGGSLSDGFNAIAAAPDGGFTVAGSTWSTDGDLPGANNGVQDLWIARMDDNGEILWQVVLGGSNTDFANDVQPTNDGGWIVAGGTISNDGDVVGMHVGAPIAYDAWLIRLDQNGNVLWHRAIGGTKDDWAWRVLTTSDGGALFAGYSQSSNGDVSENRGFRDMWVMKLSDNGATEWQRTLGGSLFDQAFDVTQRSDGAFLVVGYSNSIDGDVIPTQGNTDVWAVLLDPTGQELWQGAFGGSGSDAGQAVAFTEEGGAFIMAKSTSPDGDVSGNQGSNDVWALRLDPNGTLVGQRAFGGSSLDMVYDVVMTPEGDAVAVGWTYSSDGDVSDHHGTEGIADIWVMKFSSVAGPNGIVGVHPFEAKLTPNPASDKLLITLEQPSSSVFISISDVLGREMHSATMHTNRFEVDVAQLQRGPILVRIATDQGSRVIRVVLH